MDNEKEACVGFYYSQVGNDENSVSSDGQQFHHYQQNDQSPLILTELPEHTHKNKRP